MIADTFPLATYFDEDNTFSQSEMDDVLDKYCCPVCYSDLRVVYIPNFHRVLIVCGEHGNVCEIGRITKNTVSIQGEKAYRDYHKAIRNLYDLWGHLAEAGFDRAQALKITNYYVCEVCGGLLTLQARKDDPKMAIVDVVCPHHGNINECGYIQKTQFTYDFQRMRAWEKEHQKRKGE